MQHVVLGAGNAAGDKPGVAACHDVLAVQWHADELGAPIVAQHAQKLGDHVEDIEHNVALKHWNSNYMQIGNNAAIANGGAHVEVRLAIVSDVVANQPTSIFDRSKLLLIVQSQRLEYIFLHSLNVLMTYFLWHNVVAKIESHYPLSSLFAGIPASWSNIHVLYVWGKVTLVPYLPIIIIFKHAKKIRGKLLHWSVATSLAST